MLGNALDKVGEGALVEAEGNIWGSFKDAGYAMPWERLKAKWRESFMAMC